MAVDGVPIIDRTTTSTLRAPACPGNFTTVEVATWQLGDSDAPLDVKAEPQSGPYEPLQCAGVRTENDVGVLTVYECYVTTYDIYSSKL